MAGYGYTPKQLATWKETPRASVLQEMLEHQQTQADYWKNRALSAERRMLEHDCETAS